MRSLRGRSPVAWAKQQRRRRLPRRRAIRDVGFEVATALPDEVVADVGRTARRRAALGRLPRALDGPQRHAHLAFSGRLGQLLDRLAVAIAAQEVHPPVDAGRVALQHLLDQAHRLDVLAPVERRAEAQAGDDVRRPRPESPPAAGARRDCVFRRRAADAARCSSIAARTAESVDSRTRARAGAAGRQTRRALVAHERQRRARRRLRLAPGRRRPPGGLPRAARVSSARRRRFSMSASFSMLGHAHSSPMVSGATVW